MKEAGNFKVTTYDDGALTSDQDTSLIYISDAGLKKDMTNAQPSAGVRVQPTDKNIGGCLEAVFGITGVAS